jgi:phage shock protein A
MLKEKQNIERVISHYREEYKRVRIMVRDYKHRLRALNIKIAQVSHPPQTEEESK